MNLGRIINIILNKTVQALAVFGAVTIGLLGSSYVSTGQMVSSRVFSILNSPVLFAGIFGYLFTSILLEIYGVKDNIFE